MPQHSVDTEYEKMLNSTLNEWSLNQHTGLKQNEFPEEFSKLGLSIGSYLNQTPELDAVLTRLYAFQKLDPHHVNVSKEFLHFTFLAITKQVYGSVSELPFDCLQIKELVTTHLKQVPWILSNLRLIPGPNFLVLAGTPSLEIARARENLAKDLMATFWKSSIEDRYFPKFSFPPKIWHTTLCRYRSQYFPLKTRKFILENMDHRFGEIELPSPVLRMINFDWSKSVVL